jgi:hypothetical protein
MTAGKAFAIIYRWSVDPEHEEYFRRRWHEGTLRLKREFDSLGSCLSRDSNGDFVAFARWPSEAARARAFAAIQPLEPWPGILRCTETQLSVGDDQLTAG